MTTDVVTSLSLSYLERVGERAVATWENGLPLSARVFVYSEDELPLEHLPERAVVVDLRVVSPSFRDFEARYREDRVVQGRSPHEPHKWKSRAELTGYNFRFDAYKFARKVFALEAHERATAYEGENRLFWLDADVLFTRPAPAALFVELLSDADVCHVGRDSYHSDAALVGFRLPGGRPVLDEWHDLYATGRFRLAKEWHDAYLLDRVLERFRGTLRVRDLNPTGRKVPDVFERTPIGRYARHLKGDLKDRFT